MNQKANVTSMDLQIFDPVVPLWTPEIEEVAKLVANWVRCDHPGACISGLQRVGKSYCCRYLQLAIPAMLGNTTVAVHWSIENISNKGESETMRDCLLQSGSTAVGATKIASIKLRLYQQLEGLVRSQGARRLMIIVDEAHKMTQDHLKMFLVIFNAIELRTIQIFVLLVAEPSIWDRVKEYGVKELQMLGRFFFTTYEFKGIALDDLDELFANIDEVRGISSKLLRGHVPDGFALTNLAPLYREAVGKMAEDKSLTTPRIPMVHLRTSLNDVIYKIIEGQGVEINEKLVYESLEERFNEVINLYIEESGKPS